MAIIPLKTVDRVEVLSVMDNSIDVLMGNTPVARRAQRERDAPIEAATAGRARRFHARDDSCGRKQGHFPFRYRRHH